MARLKLLVSSLHENRILRKVHVVQQKCRPALVQLDNQYHMEEKKGLYSSVVVEEMQVVK